MSLEFIVNFAGLSLCQMIEMLKKLTAGMKIWENFIETPTMQSLNAKVNQMKLSICSEHDFRSDAYWECFVRHMAVTGYHSCCTNIMLLSPFSRFIWFIQAFKHLLDYADSRNCKISMIHSE